MQRGGSKRPRSPSRSDQVCRRRWTTASLGRRLGEAWVARRALVRRRRPPRQGLRRHAWAREHRHVVFTHDLDFGTLLALTRASGPSVVQVRTQDVLPAHLEDVVVRAIRSYQHELQKGALVTVDEARGKVRMLPLESATEF